jgi:arginine/lysine/ornithine decarboxylase
MPVREAMLSPSVEVSIDDASGCVLASASVACPPAVPILIAGERIDEGAIECFCYYGIEKIRVIK